MSCWTLLNDKEIFIQFDLSGEGKAAAGRNAQMDREGTATNASEDGNRECEPISPLALACRHPPHLRQAAGDRSSRDSARSLRFGLVGFGGLDSPTRYVLDDSRRQPALYRLQHTAVRAPS